MITLHPKLILKKDTSSLDQLVLKEPIFIIDPVMKTTEEHRIIYVEKKTTNNKNEELF